MSLKYEPASEPLHITVQIHHCKGGKEPGFTELVSPNRMRQSQEAYLRGADSIGLQDARVSKASRVPRRPAWLALSSAVFGLGLEVWGVVFGVGGLRLGAWGLVFEVWG